jgi:hypothetical protein
MTMKRKDVEAEGMTMKRKDVVAERITKTRKDIDREGMAKTGNMQNGRNDYDEERCRGGRNY